MTARPPTIPDVDYANKVRAHDPDTSWAAVAMTDKRGHLIVVDAVRLILEQHGPLTHEEIHSYYSKAGGKRTENRIRTATKELVVQGLVRQSRTALGETRNGGSSFRWELAP